MGADVSEQVQLALQKSSSIRKIFTEGVRLKAEYGEDQVHDFSLGNPCFEPPPAVQEALRTIVNSSPPIIALLHAQLWPSLHPCSHCRVVG